MVVFMDGLFDLRVPHSPEAEQAVIGSMLIDPACIPDVLQRARPDDFYLEINRDIFDDYLERFHEPATGNDKEKKTDER